MSADGSRFHARQATLRSQPPTPPSTNNTSSIRLSPPTQTAFTTLNHINYTARRHITLLMHDPG
jgi:hypothetical protein